MICYIKGSVFRRLSLSDPLIHAGLSTRAHNALAASNIHTIRDLLGCSKKLLDSIQGLGRKGMDEVTDFLYHLRSYPDCQQIYPLTAENAALLGIQVSPENHLSAEQKIPKKIKEMHLDDLPLSARAYNCLRRAGYRKVGDLITLSRKDMLNIRNLGKNTADEIINALDHIVRQNSYSNPVCMAVTTPAATDCLRFFRCVFQSDSICDLNLYHEILEEFAEAHDQNRPVNYVKLYQKDQLRQAVAGMVAKLLDGYSFGLEKDVLFGLLPIGIMLPEESFDSILSEMKQADTIRINGKISPRRMSIMEYVEIIQDERLKDMLTQRLHGVALNTIARQYGISDERVRQITANGIRKYHIKMEEDKYIPIFEEYLFTKDEFMKAFGERAEVYHYLIIVCTKKQRLPISKFQDNQNFPEEIRQGIRALLDHGHICINGEYIERSRYSFIKFVVRTYFQEDSKFDDLVVKYNELLRTLHLENDPKLILREHTYLNRIRIMDFLLWKPGHCFRYYDINSRNYDELWNTLHLDRYRNVEYSTRKFFLSEPELMKRYDIQDEFELHNLLRKICEKRKIKGITFKRTPIITFGDSDRYRQVYDILRTYSPISQHDFMSKYDSVYGLDPKTSPQYYLGPFEKYCQNGVFDVREQPPPVIKEGSAAPS